MRNSYIIPIFIAGTILFVVFVFFLIVYLIVQKNKQNKYLLEKNKLIFEHESKLLRTRIEEQESTLQNISKELHDNIGQTLGFAQMNMHMISKLATAPRQIELLKQANELLSNVHEDLRNLSHTLNSDYIKNIGLVEALQKEADYINAAQNIVCELEITGKYHDLPSEKALDVYRIAQEAIHNSLKHANASMITVRLIYEPDCFILSVADNGVGFNRDKIFELEGIGLLKIFQRARLLEGKINIQTSLGTGCTIILTIPGVRYESKEPEMAVS
jgi:signal transduction histidine kinase